MKIGDVPHKREGVLVTATPTLTIQEAIERLNKNNIGAIPVCDEANRLVGVLSERDIVRSLSKKALVLSDLTVADLMTKDVVTCSPDDEIEDVMAVMDDRNIRHMPVVEGRRLVAFVSSRDILASLLHDMKTYATKITMAYEMVR